MSVTTLFGAIRQALEDNATVVGIVAKIQNAGVDTTNPMIFYGKIPEDPPQLPAVVLHGGGYTSAFGAVINRDFTAHCHAVDAATSTTLAEAVVGALRDSQGTIGSVSFIADASIITSIENKDSVDTPVFISATQVGG